MRHVLHATCGDRFLRFGGWLCKSNGQAVIALLQLSLHVRKGRLHSLALLHACLHAHVDTVVKNMEAQTPMQICDYKLLPTSRWDTQLWRKPSCTPHQVSRPPAFRRCENSVMGERVPQGGSKEIAWHAWVYTEQGI